MGGRDAVLRSRSRSRHSGAGQTELQPLPLFQILMFIPLTKGDINEAFDKYLNPANDKIRGINKGLNYQECFDIITNSGGIPVIAHPKTLKLSNEEFENLLSDMIDKGLRGIEVYHSTHTQEEINYYKKIAEKYGLLISGGSDFHGKSKPEINIGTGINNNLKIKRLSLIDEIRKRNGN